MHFYPIILVKTKTAIPLRVGDASRLVIYPPLAYTQPANSFFHAL